MGIKLNILSILLHPSQFVYNYILNNFMEKLETSFFCRRPNHYPDHLFIPAGFALLAGQNIVLLAVLQH